MSKSKYLNNYKHQRNFCTNLLRKTKFDYFRNFNVKDLNDNKKFSKKIKTFFSDKVLASSNIDLKEKGNLITDNKKLANLFNTYFINITDTLQLKRPPLKFQSLSEIFFIRIMTAFLKSKKIISFQKNFVSKWHHRMK